MGGRKRARERERYMYRDKKSEIIRKDWSSVKSMNSRDRRMRRRMWRRGSMGSGRGRVRRKRSCR